MWKIRTSVTNISKKIAAQSLSSVAEIALPSSTDVVIIGGGSAGCHTLYHLAKKGVKAVLLERAKLTAGTTWHTCGLVWRLRPNDVDVELLNKSRDLFATLQEETGWDPGWIQNGGIFIAHSETRLDEYRRLSSLGNSLGIENYMISPNETQKLFPLLDESSFMGALYSPGDGVVDPAMLCTALTKAATQNGAKVIENCIVNDLIVENNGRDGKKIKGVLTPYGTIKTNTVVNATGVWGRDLVEKHGSYIPLVAMKHAYIVSESIPEAKGLPNIRDHDYSTYFRIQGESICMGGYENNPILLDNVAKDFHFGLYDLEWTVFEAHLIGATKICPSYGNYGVKTTICGPESFTPDHKPIMGPDMNITGLFHNCGFNSSGMMFGGGCGEQIALWIINGKPDLPMFQFDLRRFTPQQTKNKEWIEQKSHESYAKNYSMVFKHDQPLAGRNHKIDSLHYDMLERGAFMEEKQGWERPGFFLNGKKVQVAQYDWYGAYNNKIHKNYEYKNILNGDLKYTVSEHHHLIGEEALACRNNAVVFNLSYFCKMFLEGPEAKEAADWIFSGNTNKSTNKTIYTCALNNTGGVECDLTVSKLYQGTGEVHNPKFEGSCYYIVSGGASAYYAYSIILAELRNKGFNARIRDVTADIGIISIQGPKSRDILQNIVDKELSNEAVPPNSNYIVNVKGNEKKSYNVKLFRVSFVGELGYELHVPREYCSDVYKLLMVAGNRDGLRNAGYRALYSLSSEKGYHLWGYDLRPDDTPVEAGIGFTCRNEGLYKGKHMVVKQKLEGVNKRLVYLLVNDEVPLYGLEGVYRNGEAVAFLRRGEYAYYLKKSIGQAYVKDCTDKNHNYIYQVNVKGKLYDAQCHLKSPFDPEGRRILGDY